MQETMTSYSEEELYHLIGRSLLKSLPSGWQKVALNFEFLDSDVWKRNARVDNGNGDDQPVSLRPSGTEMNDAFIELARRMDEAGHGKWQAAHFNMEHTGKFDINFTYPE